jgi:predicted GNAT family acetyltransferase
MTIEVRSEPERSRYVIEHDGRLVGVAEYLERGDVLVFHHTEISPARRGQGLGEELVQHALDDVRTRGRTIVPRCWFVAEFVEHHPEYADLLAA